MRPKDLRPPFRFEERKVLCQEGILHLPKFMERYEKIDLMSCFERRAPLCIEFCSGNGHWIAEQALARPDCNWIAVEMKFPRVAKIWSKRANQQINNLFIVCGQAQTLVKNYLSDASVREVYINFPDPWPKARHAKHRLIQKPFLDELARILEPGGLFTFVTDDQPYAQQLEELIGPPFALQSRSGSIGHSTFADLWRRLGRSFHSYQFCCDGVVEEEPSLGEL